MTATPVSKEEVRLLAIEIGVREAARRLGLNEDRVCQWSKRGNWFATPKHIKAKQTPVSTVSKPGDVLLQDLAEHERETRLSLAKASRRMAKDCEELPVRHAKLAHTVAQTMAIVHRQGEGSAGQSFNLNVLNLADLKLTIGGKPVE